MQHLSIHDRQETAGNALSIQDVAKSFRSNWGRRVDALHQVSFEVSRGEIFGLLGPNGAGKSTTLKILMGLMRPSRGSGSILGRPLGSLEARSRIGFLPENPYFYDYLTATEFLETCASLTSVPRDGRRERIAGLLERVGLDPSSRQKLRKYSKGMLQRVGLAQAVLHDPEILILDEPMSGLDPTGRREVRDLIQSLGDEGKTVIFSSHILPDVEALCERVGILVQGRLRQSGRVTELIGQGRGGYEIEVRELPGSLSASWSREGILRESGDRWVVAASGREVMEERVGQILNSGGQLLGVKPLQRSLEQVFLDEVRNEIPDIPRVRAGGEVA